MGKRFRCICGRSNNAQITIRLRRVGLNIAQIISDLHHENMPI